MTETLANGYSSESTRWGLSNEYQYDRVSMLFWTKVAFSIGRVKIAKYCVRVNVSRDND